MYYIYGNNVYYNKSTAKIRLDREGQEFSLERAIKQGEPISSKLFTSLLEDLFRYLKWEKIRHKHKWQNVIKPALRGRHCPVCKLSRRTE